MSTRAFTSSSTTAVSTSTFASSKVYFRSTEAADTDNLTLSGLDDTPAAASETNALAGKVEVIGTTDWTKISAAILAAVQTGTVSVYTEGTKADGLCYLTGQPSDGDTVTLGLTGFTQTYTFRDKAQSTFVCVATADISQGEYFDITLSGGDAIRFWYDIDATGTGAPADPGGGLQEIDIATGDSASDVATATKAVIEAVEDLTSSVDTDTVTVDYDILGTLVVADGGDGVIGTITSVKAGTADAADQVAIGATTGDTATNLKKAINDEGTEGTHYGTDTAINAYLSAAVDGAILTLTDKIGCNRYLGWACAKSGTNLSIANPTGGVDGTLLTSLTAGTTSAYNAFSLDDEDVDQNLMPALTDWTSDPIQVGGKRFSIHLKASDVTTAMVASYQYSTQASSLTVWNNGASSITSLDNNSQVITPTEVVEWVRLRILNSNTAAASVNAKLVTG
jgi:hypothetical protein